MNDLKAPTGSTLPWDATQRPDAFLPLRLGARPGDGRRNRPVEDSPRVLYLTRRKDHRLNE